MAKNELLEDTIASLVSPPVVTSPKNNNAPGKFASDTTFFDMMLIGKPHASKPQLREDDSEDEGEEEGVHEGMYGESGLPFDPKDDFFSFMKINSSTHNNAGSNANGVPSSQSPKLPASKNASAPDPLFESIVDELSQILSDVPLSTIRKAVSQAGCEMERALQLLLDGNVLDEEGFHDIPEPKSAHDDYRVVFGGSAKEKGKERIRDGLTESQELLIMLQQEDALREIQRSKEEAASLELINQLQMEQERAHSEKQKMMKDDEEFTKLIAAENERINQQRKLEEQTAQQLLEHMLAEERAARQALLDAKTYTCSICFTDVTIEDLYTLEECNHRFCFDCMDNFLSTQIKDGNTSHIKCPTPNCKHMITYDEVRQVVDDTIFAKYEEFLLRNYLSTDANCRWCPRPGCGMAMIGSEDNPMLVCPNKSCNFAFCFKCREEWHHDATCEEYQQWKDMVENDNGEGEEERVPVPPNPSVTLPKNLSKRQQNMLRDPHLKKNFLQRWGEAVVSIAYPEAGSPKQPAKEPPPKPKPAVDWAKKLAEKPEELSFRQWIVSQMSEKKAGGKQVREWMKLNTKVCPKCKVNIEKNGGCNHMTCHMCKHQFCWLCLADYTSTHWTESKCKQYS